MTVCTSTFEKHCFISYQVLPLRELKAHLLLILSDVGDIKYLESGSEIFIEIMTLELIFRNKSIFVNACFYNVYIYITDISISSKDFHKTRLKSIQ